MPSDRSSDRSPLPSTDRLPSRVRAVVLYGGRSAEHDISRVSAANVVAALDPARYEIHQVAITRDGQWLLADGVTAIERDGDSLGGLPVVGTPTSASQLARLGAPRRRTDDARPSAEASEGTVVVPAAGEGDEIPTVVIPVLHGPNGEDGTVQGLLELAGVAYVGAGVLGSAVSMDKAMSKALLDAAGIPQVRWRAGRAQRIDEALLDEILDDLGPTVFVKPANMGSSVGVGRATTPTELRDAVFEAARYDEMLVFEEGVVARELEIGVLGNDDPVCSVPGEVIAAGEFYDYRDKYVDGRARTVVPADLDAEQVETMERLALRTFVTLRAEGLARVDMFYESDGRGFLVNEVNTLPGFTPSSMFPMMFAASGLGYSGLVDEMVRLALERHARRSRFLR
ncbi:MAG: D-alanine--D-alanine ligase family protein [Microthrixaceae bacterium]